MSCEAESPKVTFDALGRVESVDYPQARKVRQFAYDGVDGTIARVTVRDEVAGTVRIFARLSANIWTVSDEAGKKLGEWRGEVSVGTDGTYSIRSQRRAGATKTSRYHS